MEETALAAYRKAALRSFLMSRRARLQPEDVGLPRIGRRRTPGLTREETASLAGLAPAWYERFETQRDARPGVVTLNAVGDALQLDAVERAYLKMLSTGEEPLPRLAQPDELVVLADAFDATAFVVFDAGYQLVRANTVHNLIFDYDARATGLENNALARMFTDPARKALWGDCWELCARNMVGKVRWVAALTGVEPPIVAQLMPDRAFAEFWEQHVVNVPESLIEFEVLHPIAGRLGLRVYAPRIETGWFCGLYSPTDERTAVALRRLQRRARVTRRNWVGSRRRRLRVHWG